MKQIISIGLVVLLTVLAVVAQPTAKNPRPKTIEDRLAQYGPGARARLKPHFERIQQSYPPGRLVFLGIKEERTLQLFVATSNEPPKFLRSYPILAASGELGPKLREGDHQVPEGIYKIELLNPNSSYHLSMRVSYPNAFDRAQARKEGRTNLGGDIMIHGKAFSVGCLAMGDEAAEELFVLAADTRITNITVLLAPVDFRVKALPASATNLPAGSGEIYEQLKPRLRELPGPRLGVLRPVAAFPAWATCRPSSTAFSGAMDDLMLTLRSKTRVLQMSVSDFNRREVACVKSCDRSQHSRAQTPSVRSGTGVSPVRWAQPSTERFDLFVATTGQARRLSHYS